VSREDAGGRAHTDIGLCIGADAQGLVGNHVDTTPVGAGQMGDLDPHGALSALSRGPLIAFPKFLK
jgi:hypothetical protein